MSKDKETRKRGRDECVGDCSEDPRREDSPHTLALRDLDMELQRSREVYSLSRALADHCRTVGNIDDSSLFVGFVFESIAARAAYAASHSNNLTDRTWLHTALDMGRRVACIKGDHSASGVLKEIKFDFGEVKAVVQKDGVDGQEETFLLDECRAIDPIPLALDPLVPCGEIVMPHKAPLSVYYLSLSKLCEADKQAHSAAFNHKKKLAWRIADHATKLAYHARLRLREYVPTGRERHVRVERSTSANGEGEVLLTLDGWDMPFSGEHRLVDWQYAKLRRFYTLAGSSPLGASEDEELFHLRLFGMLQRYHGVTGLFSRVEAGWHAAVPDPPFNVLIERMNITAECFASPLNARLSAYCSAFADTDRHFGSLGSFLEYWPTGGSFEVGPPYDHEVIRLAFDHALACLERQQAGEPLSFVFVVPESERESGKKVRAEVDKSRFNRISEVLKKEEAKYIDGFQHRPGEHRLICISCDTRIVVLQNDAAAARWPPKECFALLREAWVGCAKQK